MRLALKLSIIIFSCLLTCCENNKFSHNESYSLENKNLNNSILQPESEIILEVISRFESDLLWIRGDIVNFRLYSNGFAEFDDCPSESIDGKQIIAEKSCVRQSTKLDDAELNEFNKLLASKDFRSLKNNYRKIESSCDAIPLVKIQTKNKLIRIEWCDNLTYPFRSPDFPNVISKIFQQSREIRNRSLGKEVLSP